MPNTYHCTVIGGTGTASAYLGSMLQAWGIAQGLQIFPGTLNLCADRPVDLPAHHISLGSYADHLALTWRKATPGFDPRLYAVVLDGRIDVWIFRWSAPESIVHFVGDTPECPAVQRCEIVAERHLRSELGLADQDTIEILIRDD